MFEELLKMPIVPKVVDKVEEHLKSERAWKLAEEKQYRIKMESKKDNNPRLIPRWLMFDVVIEHVKKYKKLICIYCKKELSTRDIHFDHVVPFSKNGKHTITNIKISCGPCNGKKHAKNVKVFLREIERENNDASNTEE